MTTKEIFNKKMDYLNALLNVYGSIGLPFDWFETSEVIANGYNKPIKVINFIKDMKKDFDEYCKSKNISYKYITYNKTFTFSKN